MNSFKDTYTQNKKNLNKDREENRASLKWSKFIIELLLEKARQGDPTAFEILEQSFAYNKELQDELDDKYN